ncbi:hypothetical protein Pfo_000290 [Paulownia fortunei]|nr:hypothetical protein Pfo_000290 [Paulownia fortunei]
MAFSSVPSNFLSPSSKTRPSQSQFFLKFHHQTHSLKSFRARKLKISCCQQIVQLDNENQHKTNLVKKKRKPRPSFLEQVQNKWSLKTPSLRENFPWQEQESGDTNQEFQAQSLDVSSEKESEKSSSVSEPVSSHTKIRSTLAPWVHGNEPRKEVFNPEGSRKSQEKVHPKDQGLDGFHEHCRNEEPLVIVIQGSDDLVKEVTLDGKSEEKCGEFDEIPIGLPETNEVLGAEESKNVTFVEDSSTIYQVTKTIKCSADANDLKRLPWERKIDEEFVTEDKLRSRNTELAERLIPEHELKRLRNVSLRMVERMKVGAAGVTQALVDAIHEKWKDEEVVKLKFEGPPSKNMKRTHEFLESRTGGLVIWRSGSSVVLYRGMAYQLDCVKSYGKHVQADAGTLSSFEEDSPQSIKFKRLNGGAESSRVYNSHYFKNLSEEEQMDLSELNLLLDELGPRFIDWSGREPLPVDADLLPAVVPGYKTPFRLLPHGTKQSLRNKEMTYLRRTARTLPPHFALGRNRELQGLATAMVKLWKKSAIAKIAIKRGVQNTSNERMAEELKILTGGTLLSRNKEFIVFYRGNDFLPPKISSALMEAEKFTALQQDEEEQARHRAAALIDPKAKASKQPLVAGTLAETVAATSRWGNQPNSTEMEKMMKDTAVAKHASLVNSLQRKLALAKGKIRKAEKTLQKVLENQEPENLPTDLETLTDEERFLFRRIGLSMKPYLLLGRREIFDGTIENMHLHWKYRELVKIIVERKTFSQVKHIAVSLEAESGGVLVSVDKTTKGYVIIVYRGKNYQRPLAFRPKNLLTKRQALARSIELQRREALKHHVLELEEKVEKLKQELEDMMDANNIDAETLDSRISAACDDNDGEDVETEEGERAYLQEHDIIKKYGNS